MAAVADLGATVAANAAVVRERITAAGGDPATTVLVAVTKGFGPEAPRAAKAAGLVDVGENYGQELAAKAAAVEGVRWHFLGQIQRNKVRTLAAVVDLWQSVDRLAVAGEIARRRPGAAVLLQVNLSGEPHKGGCAWDELDRLAAGAAGFGLDVRGLMGVGPAGPPEAARPGFRRLAEARRALGLVHLSIGMSADLEVAVEEGATMIRIGTALFGPRPARPDL